MIKVELIIDINSLSLLLKVKNIIISKEMDLVVYYKFISEIMVTRK